MLQVSRHQGRKVRVGQRLGRRDAAQGIVGEEALCVCVCVCVRVCVCAVCGVRCAVCVCVRGQVYGGGVPKASARSLEARQKRTTSKSMPSGFNPGHILWAWLRHCG